MSSILQPFNIQKIFGLIRVNGSPIPIPDLQTEWPAHTPEGHPNRGFISSCFLHLPLEDGERLRTLLNHTLQSQWWRAGHFDDAPMAALDPFVDGTHGVRLRSDAYRHLDATVTLICNPKPCNVRKRYSHTYAGYYYDSIVAIGTTDTLFVTVS
ncbi:hypothetical protein FRB91_005264 [Serendipita sp. 411]|nr:hypothetical protein FRB91_005264 [Serendipita sp. 411]